MKDDMTAFIEGLGMRRFFGYVECEEVPSVLWDSGQIRMAGRILWSWPSPPAPPF